MKFIVIMIVLLIISTFLYSSNSRSVNIENFDNSETQLFSYESYDNVNNWSYNSSYTYNNSAFSLYFQGSNSKYFNIDPLIVQKNTVLASAIRVNQSSQMIAIGFSDGTNSLIYSIKGSLAIDSLNWIDDYVGLKGLNEWYNYELPIGDDWFGLYDYYPQITKVILINRGTGRVYFDEICDITEDIPESPLLTFRYYRLNENTRDHQIHFFSMIHNFNPEETYEYFWEFGDGNTSQEANPVHTYSGNETRIYSILLKARSGSGKWSYTSEKIELDHTETFLPYTINFVGDVMLARTVNNINPTSIFNDVRGVLSDAHLTVANLESALTNATSGHPTKTIRFKASPDMVAALSDGGIDVVSTANNHIYDYLDNGITETLNVLDANGILHSGAGINEYEAGRPLLINRRGRVLAFLASSDRDGSYNNYQPFLQAAHNKGGFFNLKPSALRSQLEGVEGIADIKIVEMHAGSEYSLKPGADYDKSTLQNDYYFTSGEEDDSAPRIDYPIMWDSELRHYAIDQGADIVIVHHPHIIQGFEIYNQKLIAHSLGNFVFDLDRADTKASMILKAKLNREGFYAYEVIPIFLDNSLPKTIQNDAALRILNYLAFRSRELNTYLLVDKNTFTAEVCVDTLNLSPNDELISRSVHFSGSSDLSDPIIIKEHGDFSQITQITPAGDYQYRAGRSLMFFSAFENPEFNQWELNTNAIYDNSTAFSGTYSFKLSDPAPANEETFSSKYKHRIMSSQNHSFFTMLKTSNLEYVKMQIYYYATPGSQNYSSTQEYTLDISNSNNWKAICIDLNNPQSTTGFLIKLKIKSLTGMNGYAQFDNTDVIEWSAWQENITQNQLCPNAYYYLQLMKDGDFSQANISFNERTFVPVFHEDPYQNQSKVTNIHQESNYPNPFNPSTSISFNLKESDHVQLSIYNIKGQLVNKLVNEHLESGHHSVQWLGIDHRNNKVSSGIYFYEIKSSNDRIVRKMMLIK